MRNLFLSAMMLTGVIAFAQEQPAKQAPQTTKQPVQSDTIKRAGVQSQDNLKTGEPATSPTTVTPAKKEDAPLKSDATIRKERTVEKKAEPAKKAN